MAEEHEESDKALQYAKIRKRYPTDSWNRLLGKFPELRRLEERARNYDPNKVEKRRALTEVIAWFKKNDSVLPKK